MVIEIFTTSNLSLHIEQEAKLFAGYALILTCFVVMRSDQAKALYSRKVKEEF
jgi:hypothetical protein